jgi:murein DD-endopeptidase MepM/ murein hydrolase activator NlpD
VAATQAQANTPTVRMEFGLPIDSFEVITNQVQEKEFLSTIFIKLDASKKTMQALYKMPNKQLPNIQPGKTYKALYKIDAEGQKQLCHFVYQPNIKQDIVFHLGDSIVIEKQEKTVVNKTRSACISIESSLWNAMADNGLPTELALELSDIYAWTIDFFGLQKGDSIRIYFDEQYVDNQRIGLGRIYAANFYHGKQWQDAFWFDNGEISNYFDAEGNSLRKAFLKAPLNYKRISSEFTYARKHPIYKTVRPHTGVDYAAPTGTPVVSIGDGKVILKEYKGGGGNTVKIKHNATYTTAYLHLSKYATGLEVGSHVKQGQVIGYVGSTGASTGPHLDFRVWKNEDPIDPLKMKSPPAEPIPAKYKEDYAKVVAEYKEKLIAR